MRKPVARVENALSALFAAVLVAAAALPAVPVGTASAAGPEIVTLDAPSPLIEVRVMVRAGSAQDPEGLEGLASLTAEALLEGAYGDPESPITKEELARITRRWGEDAKPDVLVDKESTTFSLTVPKDVLDEYLERVFEPLFTQPLFLEEEIDRLRDESLTLITGMLRYENVEMLGLESLDNYVFRGTPHGHLVVGSVQSLKAISRDDVLRFYKTYYRTENMILGLSTTDETVVGALSGALQGVGETERTVRTFPKRSLAPPEEIDGREMVIVAMPDPGATGIHAAFPLPLTRQDPDFWPLYVGNVYFGTHRDNHSHLYQEIREARGYNYGDYSYVEHFAYRPFALFPPFNTPRHFQYFSMWIRPVGTEYAHHILKAMTWELENLLHEGVSEEDVALSKNKAKTLYLNLAEDSSRLLAAKMDDAFYGMEKGYLEHYLERIDAVTAEGVNKAVRSYLQAENVKFLIVTDAETADDLRADILADRNNTGKTPEDYRIETEEVDGKLVYHVPEEKLEILEKDAVWSHYWMGLERSRIRVVPVESLFETGAFVTPPTSTD
jgi:zinc protease